MIFLFSSEKSLHVTDVNNLNVIYAAFFNCTPVGRASDSMMARLKAIHFSWLGPELLVCCLAHRGPTGVFLLLRS